MRPDRATCAICMESLFGKRDDLDDLFPIATADCGHVFHEGCLHEWFDVQARAYVVAQRDQYGREDSPSPSEAPAECPTCRTECFADPETGRPATHRLFINFGEQDGGSSSMAGSSPVRGPSKRDKEVMGLARRARGLGEEVRDLSTASEMDDVEGFLRRSQALKDDVASSKAIEGIKRYVGALGNAINYFRETLITDPLPSELRVQLALSGERAAELERTLQDTVDRVIPAERRRAKDEERRKADKQVQRAQDDLVLVKRELEREQVLRRRARAEHEERLSILQTKVTEAEQEATKEKDDRVALQATLQERTKQMRQFQAKAESRKALRTELEDAQKTIAKLREEQAAQLSASFTRYQDSSPSPRKRSRRSFELVPASNDDEHFEDDRADEVDREHATQHGDTSNDISIQEISPSTFAGSMQHAGPSKTKKPRSSVDHEFDHDYSLSVDEPSLDRSLSYDVGNSQNRRAPINPTARSYASDAFNAKPRTAASDPRSSKYFASSSRMAAGMLDAGRSKTNPFPSSRADTERRKRLAPTQIHLGELPELETESESEEDDVHSRSPLRDHGRAPLRPVRPANRPTASSSHGALSTRVLVKSTSSSGALSKFSSRVAVKSNSERPAIAPQRSIVEALGLTDRTGRPTKNLATGTKARRNA